MVRRPLLFAMLVGCITTAWAAEPTPAMLGNITATLHQTCGKQIFIQVAEMKGADAGRTIIGIKNNQTGDIDLFTSFSASNKQYDKYQPVTFDNLSKTLVAMESERPPIVWGGAMTNLKGMEYSLALGSHVYQCSKLVPFESEVANDLYGETDTTAH
ncbi:hypothetical protein [Buttiauxella brennerae]|nr:hypothetical protein [Buttiauxella brennerae]